MWWQWGVSHEFTFLNLKKEKIKKKGSCVWEGEIWKGIFDGAGGGGSK